MKQRIAFSLLPVIIALSLLAAFMITAPVFAQDELPPEAPVPTETAPVIEENPIVEPVPTEVVPQNEVTSPEDIPAEETLVEPPGVPEVVVEPSIEESPDITSDGFAPTLEALADAGLVLADQSGEPLSMASEDTVDAIVGSDPYFKVGTVTYNFTLADCDPGPDVVACSNPLQAAVDYISNNGKIPSDGFIHIDSGTSLANQSVHIYGTYPYLNSLKGIVGHVNQDTFSPDVFLTGTSYIYVNQKSNGFTISGININGDSTTSPGPGVVSFISCAGNILLQDLVLKDARTTGPGIRITNHNGLVTLKNVDSSGNGGGGAFINNSSGTSGVTVTNSSLNDNSGNSGLYPANGLHILTKGSITINGVSISRNHGLDPGLWIEGGTTVTIKSSEFNNNTGGKAIEVLGINGNITLTNVYADYNYAGINLGTKGNITLTNVESSGNDYWGANLDTCGGTPCTNTTGTGKIILKDSKFEMNSDNGGTGSQAGLIVKARGSISLTNISAYRNGFPGSRAAAAYLDNSQANLVSAVTVINSIFDASHANTTQLEIHSKGLITLDRVSSSASDASPGVLLDNYLGTAGVTIKGISTTWSHFDKNSGDGLSISTKGNISLTFMTAWDNTGYGFNYLNNTTLNNITINNGMFDSNGNRGLSLNVLGTISLSNINANGNVGIGASLVNNLASSPKNVTIKNGTFMGNTTGSGIGLYIYTKGVVNASNIYASGNASYGAYIDQFPSSGGATPTYPAAVVNNGYFSSNANIGLYIGGRGPITVSNITADSNTTYGTYLLNYVGNVSLLATGSSGGNNFKNNSTYGLAINTPNSVILK